MGYYWCGFFFVDRFDGPGSVSYLLNYFAVSILCVTRATISITLNLFKKLDCHYQKASLVAMPMPAVELGGLQTETRNPRTTSIDRVSTQELCRLLHREDCSVPAAVEPCLPVIAAAIDSLSERVRHGGRVFYIGAGTSGR